MNTILYKKISINLDETAGWKEFSTDDIDFNDFKVLLDTLFLSGRYRHLYGNAVVAIALRPGTRKAKLDRLLDRAELPGIDELKEVLRETVEDLVRIIGYVNRLKNLIAEGDIADRVSTYITDSGRVSTINLSDILRELIESKRKIQNIGMTVVTEETNLSVSVRNDITFFEEIVKILIENSVRALDKDKKQIEITLKKKGNGVEVEIEDNGRGIPHDELPSMFLPGFVCSNDPDKVKHFGLGLTMVYIIVKYFEGKIIVRSKIGVGARIKIFIPFSDKFILAE